MGLVSRCLDKMNRLFWSLMPSCQKTIYLISLDLDRDLPWSQRLPMRLHYYLCVYIRRYSQQVRGMQRFLRSFDEDDYQLFDQHPLPQKYREKIRSELKSLENPQR